MGWACEIVGMATPGSGAALPIAFMDSANSFFQPCYVLSGWGMRLQIQRATPHIFLVRKAFILILRIPYYATILKS